MNVYVIISFLLSTIIIYLMEKYTCLLGNKTSLFLKKSKKNIFSLIFVSFIGILGVWNFFTSLGVFLIATGTYIYYLFENIELVFAVPFIISFVLLPFFFLNRSIHRYYFYQSVYRYTKWYSWCCASLHIAVLILSLFSVFMIPMIFAIIASLHNLSPDTWNELVEYVTSSLLGTHYELNENKIDSNTILGDFLPMLFALGASPWLAIRVMYYDRKAQIKYMQQQVK